MPGTDIPTFATAQLKLLELELKAELEENSTFTSQLAPSALARAGAAILNLQVSSQRTGFGGKTVLELEVDAAVGGGDIPEHGIRTGDIVGVQEQAAGSAKKKEKADLQKKGVEGVVLKVTTQSISVALDKDEVDIPSGKLWLYVLRDSNFSGMLLIFINSVRLANDVTHKRFVCTTCIQW